MLMCAVVVLAIPGVAGSAFAQPYPARPIAIVVPFPPGGVTDTLARLLAQKFTEAWGQPATVDNKPGAAGMIGATAVAKSPANGYTLFLGVTSAPTASIPVFSAV